jgi:hypothetical protein
MEIKVASCSITKEILNAAGMSQTVPLFRIPSDCIIQAVGARVKTAFAGVTRPEVSAGTSSDTTRYLPKQHIATAGDLIGSSSPIHSGLCNAPGSRFIKTEAEQDIMGTFTSSTGNFSSLSAGEILFYCIYLEP